MNEARGKGNTVTYLVAGAALIGAVVAGSIGLRSCWQNEYEKAKVEKRVKELEQELAAKNSGEADATTSTHVEPDPVGLAALLSGVSLSEGKARYEVPLASCGVTLSVTYDLKTVTPMGHIKNTDSAECISVVFKNDGSIDVAQTAANLGAGFLNGKNTEACLVIYDRIKQGGFTQAGKCLDEAVAKYKELEPNIKMVLSMYNALHSP